MYLNPQPLDVILRCQLNSEKAQDFLKQGITSSGVGTAFVFSAS